MGYGGLGTLGGCGLIAIILVMGLGNLLGVFASNVLYCYYGIEYWAVWVGEFVFWEVWWLRHIVRFLCGRVVILLCRFRQKILTLFN